VKGSCLKIQSHEKAGCEGVNDGAMIATVLAAFKETTAAASVRPHPPKPLSAPDRGYAQAGLDGLLQSCGTRTSTGRQRAARAGHRARRLSYEAVWGAVDWEIKKAIPLEKDLGVKSRSRMLVTSSSRSGQAMDYPTRFTSQAVGWHFDIGNVGPQFGPASDGLSCSATNRENPRKGFQHRPTAFGCRGERKIARRRNELAGSDDALDRAATRVGDLRAKKTRRQATDAQRP